ncbi:uncharacterized protein LOC131428835 [Malaya genurostris]|uniref:uncharacterized protein LOC131428835 n=1 Tax=Malaya genurostris TaxID=325434 RepID=UPI0026F39B29|nr:uncharacterized protein LOC131428835 [Malaya genurostris]
MEITQINLNHCDTAQQLLWQSMTETKCDVAIISEPYQVPPDNGNWVSDRTGMAAIHVMGEFPIQEVVESASEGIVIAKINGVFVCSCYTPPRWTVEQFSQVLEQLTNKLIGRKPVVIGGDFNAWAVEWGSRVTNARGYILQEALAKLEVRLCNEGSVSTFRKDGRESIIDVTFCSPNLAANMNWKVSEEYTHSDHQAIHYRIGQRIPVATRRSITDGQKWKTKTFNKDLFIEALRSDGGVDNIDATELKRRMMMACDTTMLRKSEPTNSRRPAYWWNETLSMLRAACLRARRRAQRARTETEIEERKSAFREARSAFKREIKRSKSNCYKRLCREADANPWGTHIELW